MRIYGRCLVKVHRGRVAMATPTSPNPLGEWMITEAGMQ